MLRILWYLIKLAAVVFVAIWLAQRPGEVSLEWLGYRIDTSVGIILLVAFLFGVLAAIAYRFWGLLLRSPRSLFDMFDRSRRRRGYKALTKGMVAVAAGDAMEASRLAQKADALLQEPPLTLLLQAQAAQLQGDENAARRYFEAMLDDKETRFLGLRGLMTQCLKAGDHAAALTYARQAHQMRPKAPWLLEILFDLSERAGDYSAAARAVKDWSRSKALPAPEAARKRAVLLTEQARRTDADGKREEALRLVREAHKLAPDLLPATLLLARLLVETQRRRDAARVMERAWATQPHPEFVALYRRARPTQSPIEALQSLGRLVEGWRSHEEARLAQAEAALEAKLWGEARRYLATLLEALEGRAPSERACWLMARLEESEHGDAKKARDWLMRAGEAAPNPVWVCESCGTVADAWSARCGACESFDSLKWDEPPRVGGTAALAVTGEEGSGLPAPAEAKEMALQASPPAVQPSSGEAKPPARAVG